MSETEPTLNRYDSLAGRSDNLSCGRPLEAARVAPGERCIDLGCGRGAEALRLAQSVGPTGRVWGVDVSPRMLEVATRSAADAGLGHIEFVQSDLSRIDLPDAIADWLFSNCALNHASDKWGLWREIHRLLRPGGSFVVSDIYAVEPIPARYRDDPEAVAQCWAGAVVRSEYLAQIESAGLVEVQVLRESAPYVRGAARLASFTLTGQRPH